MCFHKKNVDTYLYNCAIESKIDDFNSENNKIYAYQEFARRNECGVIVTNKYRFMNIVQPSSVMPLFTSSILLLSFSYNLHISLMIINNRQNLIQLEIVQC